MPDANFSPFLLTLRQTHCGEIIWSETIKVNIYQSNAHPMLCSKKWKNENITIEGKSIGYKILVSNGSPPLQP